MAWIQHHVIATCQVCEWSRQSYGTDEREGARVLTAGRRHAQRTGHYVQVERGQHAHYGRR